MEDHAVGLSHLQRRTVHDQQAFFQVHIEKGQRSRILVQRYQMAVIREQGHILGIFSAHRQAQQPGQEPGFLVDPVNRSAVVSRIGAAQIIEILGQIQCARGRTARVIVVQRADALDLLKERVVLLLPVGINVNAVFQLMDDVEILAVFAEFQTSTRLSFPDT